MSYQSVYQLEADQAGHVVRHDSARTMVATNGMMVAWQDKG